MSFPGPTTYTPFFRQFANERAIELREARQLYVRVADKQATFTETNITVGSRIYDQFDYLTPENLRHYLAITMDELIRSEDFMTPLPPFEYERLNMVERAGFIDLLRRKEYFFENQERVLQHHFDALVRIFASLAELLPSAEAPSPFTIPLAYALPDPRLIIDKIYGTLVDQPYADRGLFRRVVNVMYQSLCRVSGREPNVESRRPWKYASDNLAPLDEIVDTYLAGTPFHALFMAPIPLKLTHAERMNHMHVIGGTGAGKTTLLENLIVHDLTSEDQPSLVVIDSQGDLIRKLSNLESSLARRTILITPKDIRNPPAINIFDVNRGRLGQYDEATREQVTAGVIQTFDYLFTGLLGADLTAKQGVVFRFIARLMLTLPDTMGRNATVLDMLRLMTDDTPYREAIRRLPPIAREFFERDFADKNFKQTKEQIRYRLNAILENPTLARLFTSPETKVDFFTELNQGSVILIDTSKEFLKGASSHFGRIFISLILQAILERAAIPERERKDTFLIVDEAANYFDSNIDDLLTDARKYRCGCVFAHQYLDQCTSSLRASLAANTSIKFASGVSTADARALASDMRTTPDFILNQPRLQFAAHIRNTTPQAVSIPVQWGSLERERQLTSSEYEIFLEMNRSNVSLPPVAQALPSAPPPVSTPDLGTDVAEEW